MMDKFFYAITVIGKDKPGIVANVAKVLYEQEFNIEDSSSTFLRDQFSMILIVSNKNNIGLLELKKSFASIRKDLELSISIRNIEVLDIKKPYLKNYMISIYGSDKPGIVYYITKKLSELEINIVDLRTRISGAKKDIYIMILEVEIPKSISINTVNEMLKEICEQMGVDFSLRLLESYSM